MSDAIYNDLQIEKTFAASGHFSAYTGCGSEKVPTPFALRALFAGKKCLSYYSPETTLAYIQHGLYRSQTVKQKTQERELSALVPASFVFSDYDEYAAVSYSFTRVVFYLPFLCVRLLFILRGSPVGTR